jgi:hypothetical protein
MDGFKPGMTVREYMRWDRATYRKRGFWRPADEYEAYVTLCAAEIEHEKTLASGAGKGQGEIRRG